MFPPVYQTLRTSEVEAIVDDRIGRHGEVAQTEARPYVVWQVVAGVAHDNLSNAPGSDFTTTQIDCYAADQATVEALAVAVRAALDSELIVSRIILTNRDTETRLYRVGLEADFITRR
jgi:hypothetical protein